MNKLLNATNAEREVIEKVKVKILDAIKHHIKKGYKNHEITMDKQHSYHVREERDIYILYHALNILNKEFEFNNIPIIINRYYKSSEQDIFGAFDIAIVFTINK